MSQPHALMIGGTSPIGSACADLFAGNGWIVSTVGSPFKDVAGTETGPHYRVDLEDITALPALFQQIRCDRGTVSCLAFFQRYRGSGDAWAGEFAVSLRATDVFIEQFRTQPAEGSNRSIVIVTSPTDAKVALEQPTSYHAGKAALSQMIRCYALQLGPMGIRVNGVQPSIVLKSRARDFYARHPQLVRLYEQITPLGRFGTPEDIAAAVLFLAGPTASFITGQILAVDGGVSLHEAVSLARLAAGLADISVTLPPGDARK